MKFFFLATVIHGEVSTNVEKSTVDLLRSLQEDDKASSALGSKLDSWCHREQGEVGKSVIVQNFMLTQLAQDLEERQAATNEILDTLAQIRARKSLLTLDLDELDKQIAKVTEHGAKHGNVTRTTDAFHAMRTNRVTTLASLDAQLNTWLPMLADAHERVASTKRHRAARVEAAAGLTSVKSWLEGVCGRWDAEMLSQSKERLDAVNALTQTLADLRPTPAVPSFLQLVNKKHKNSPLREKIQDLMVRLKSKIKDKASQAWCSAEVEKNMKEKRSAVDRVRRITALEEATKQSTKEISAESDETALMKKKLVADLEGFEALDKEATDFFKKISARAPLAVKIVAHAKSLSSNNKAAVKSLDRALTAFQAIAKAILPGDVAPKETLERALDALDAYFTLTRDQIAERELVKTAELRRAQAQVAAADEYVKNLVKECAATVTSVTSAKNDVHALEDELNVLDGTQKEVTPQDHKSAVKIHFETPVEVKARLPANASPLERAALEIGVALE